MKIKSFLIMTGLLLCGSAMAQDLTIVEDLASYTGTDATVFSKADGNVYKYNSMGQYEKYGVYEVVDFAAPQVTEVEYITNAANSELFIPDYRPKSNTRVFATVEIASTTGGRAPVFGTRDYTGSWPNAFYFETVNDSKVHAKLVNEDDFATDGTPYVGVKSVFDLNGSTGQSNVYVNGNTIASATWTKWADDYDYKYFLSFFSVNQNNTDLRWRSYQPENMKLYGAKIYEGNTLVMDLVPVVTSDGKGGLKDRLTGSVYTNGRGTISASGSYSVADASKGVATYEDKLVYNTADNNMYRWNGSAWENQGLGLQEISDTKYYKFYDNSTDTWNWSYPGSAYDGTFAGYKTDVSATYGSRANHNDAQIGAGGHEPLQYNMTCFESGANYRLSFDFTTGGFSSWSGSVYSLPLYLYAGNYGSVGDWGYLSEHIGDANTWAYVQVPFNAQSDWHIARNFTATGDKASFIFPFGAVSDGGDGFKFWFDNIYIQKYLYPATYPAISLTSAIEALIAEADAFDSSNTTPALSTTLTTARNEADAHKNDADLSKQKDVLDALQKALDNAKAVDITILRQTIAIVEPMGIDVTAANDFLANGTSNAALIPIINALRQARQFKAKGEHITFTGTEPVVGETYYLYNVGQKRFLCGAADGGHQIALDFIGEAVTVENNSNGGYQLKNSFHDKWINHWAGTGYLDCGENRTEGVWYFIAVGGNKYSISSAETNDGATLLGYNAPAVPTYGLGALDATNDWAQTLNSNCSDANNANNQWMFVSKAERDALLATATEANGIDASYYIKDAKFDRNHNQQSSWTFDGVSVPSGEWEDMTCDAWDKGNIKVYQELTGLKPGKYKVSVQGLYRHLVHNSEYPLAIAGTNKTDGAVVYGTNGAGETKTAYLKTIADMVDNIPGMGQPVEVAGVKHYIPCDSRYYKYRLTYNGYQYWFHNGLNWSTTDDYVVVGDDGKLTIGVEKTSTDSGEYLLLDNFRLTYYGPVSKEITLTNGYATFSAAESYKVTTGGVNAYKVTEKKNSYVILTAIEDIPANTGVVLYGEGAAKAELEQVGETTADVSGNMMKPNVTASVLSQESDGCKNYLLACDSNDSSVCVFRPSSGKGTLAAGRAYLALPIESSGVKYYIGFDDDDATAISLTPNPSPVGEGSIYNLAGQRLEKMQKGVNIVNGKKILK
ncbi:MAG: hypothetical protein IJ577_00230 [Prevotella sp.]|nr:hypothetical protein [Prevotella sp.]